MKNTQLDKQDGGLPSRPLIGSTVADRRETFEWGQKVEINGKEYWLNKCRKCISGDMTYHIIEGVPPEPENYDEDYR